MVVGGYGDGKRRTTECWLVVNFSSASVGYYHVCGNGGERLCDESGI